MNVDQVHLKNKAYSSCQNTSNSECSAAAIQQICVQLWGSGMMGVLYNAGWAIFAYRDKCQNYFFIFIIHLQPVLAYEVW